MTQLQSISILDKQKHNAYISLIKSLQNHPTLISLNLKDCVSWEVKDLLPSLASYISFDKTLLNTLNTLPILLNTLNTLPTLEVFSFTYNKIQINDEFFETISNLKNLKILRLCSFYAINLISLSHVLKKIPMLMYLGISSEDSTRNRKAIEYFAAAISKLPNLISLDLDKHLRSGDDIAFFSKAIQECKLLESLKLSLDGIERLGLLEKCEKAFNDSGLQMNDRTKKLIQQAIMKPENHSSNNLYNV